jgi:predicted nuclease of predicted toxin-antitoxin system
MRVYLDDDIAAGLLARLLRNEGHDVVVPADVGLDGAYDSVHMTHAIRDGRVLLTLNHGDYERLHQLVRTAGGHHPGLWTVRKDNDPNRDMKPANIVRAVRNLLKWGVPIPDELIVLNQYR